MNNHTTFHRMKRLRVKLITGEVFIDRLLEKKSTYYVFKNRGKVKNTDILSASYVKGYGLNKLS